MNIQSIIKCLIAGLMILLCVNAFANLPFKNINWPNDDRAHVNNPKVVTEWWTYAGKLTAKDDYNEIHQFFYYISLRFVRDLSGDVPTLNVVITDLDRHKVYDNYVVLKDARVSFDQLDITSKNFELTSDKVNYDLQLVFPSEDQTIALDLHLTPLKKPILMGSNPSRRGVIDMGNQTNAFNYSISNLHTSGVMQVGDDQLKIIPSGSSSWMDHQWGDFSVSKAFKTHAWLWVGARLSKDVDVSVKQYIKPITEIHRTKKTSAALSLKNSDEEHEAAAIKIGPASEGGYPAYYVLTVGGQTYRLEPLVKELNRNNTWVGILKVDGQSIKEDDAPFAIVESMVPQL